MGRVSASHPVKTEIGTCDYTYVTPLLGTKLIRRSKTVTGNIAVSIGG